MFTRQCQECGHRQSAKKPTGDLTDSYRNAKCRKCRSPALDYGSSDWVLVKGKYIRLVDDNEED